MTKSGDKQVSDTKLRILDATLEALRTEGFAGATSRTIARIGGLFNQALIFYHFGSLDAVLLAALDQSSSSRLERYRSALAQADSISELIRLAAEIYREDRESGHTTVVAQMVAGSLARPELAPRTRRSAWNPGSASARTRSPRSLIDPLSQSSSPSPTSPTRWPRSTWASTSSLTLDQDSSRTDALFDRSVMLAPLIEELLGGSAPWKLTWMSTPPPLRGLGGDGGVVCVGDRVHDRGGRARHRRWMTLRSSPIAERAAGRDTRAPQQQSADRVFRDREMNTPRGSTGRDLDPTLDNVMPHYAFETRFRGQPPKPAPGPPIVQAGSSTTTRLKPLRSCASSWGESRP